MAVKFSLKRYEAAPPLARARAVAAGLPVAALRELVADEAVTLADLAGLVGPRRTLHRRLAEDERLTPEESDRLARFIRILDLAAAIFGGRRPAMAWLSAAKRRLDGERPLDLLRTDAGTQLVEDLLQQARHGFVA